MKTGDVIGPILDFLLPRECVGCRAGHENFGEFCGECETEAGQVMAAPRCLRCSMPVTLAGSPCAVCAGKGPALFDRIVSLGVLREPLKSAIHRSKYEKRWPIAERLSDRLSRRPDLREMLEDSDVFVPVPLHPNRQRERGFNQAEIIARRLRKNYEGMNRPAVVMSAARVVATETQTHMPSAAAREENLRNAFVLTNAKAVAGQRVVLVDDVMTTGSTLRALARTVRGATPASVSAVVLCVADPKGKAFEVI